MASKLEDAGAPVFLGGMARGLLGADSSVQCRHARGKELVLTDPKSKAPPVCMLYLLRLFPSFQTLNMI